MNSWHNLIHLDNCKEVVRLTMNDMIGVYEKELAYLKEGQDTVGLEDVGVTMEEHYVTRFTEY